MSKRVTVAIPCRADEPGLGATLASVHAACQYPELPSGLLIEMVICINGVKRDQECPPLHAVHAFCPTWEMRTREIWLDEEGEPGNIEQAEQLADGLTSAGSPIQLCTVLVTEHVGKPRAWNLLWKRAGGELVLFCDADVRVETAAVFHLLNRLRHNPHLRLIAAREVPVVGVGATVWSQMGAIPYRFDFGNAGGRLYLLRKNALAGEMPEDLLLEDAWLTVAVGRRWVAKEWHAQVFFLPPATRRDYFAERVRTEGGKLQIHRLHAALLSEGPIARYPWRQFWHNIALREYPLVLLALGVRVVARLKARMALTRKDFYTLYRPFSSTKRWASVER